MIKTQIFDEKQQKSQLSLCKHNVAFFTLNSPSFTRNVTCPKLQGYGENIGDEKLSVTLVKMNNNFS